MSDQDDQDNPSSFKEEISDEEAMRLLMEMDEPPEQSESVDLTQTKTDPAPEPSATETVEEIGEWLPNEFQSDAAMMQDFLSNAEELLENLDEQLLNLESNPSSKETIEEIFRAAHTLKGASGMFGFAALERIMHRMENLFDLIRKGDLVPNSDIIDLLLAGMDTIRSLVNAVREGKPCGIKTAELVSAIEQAAAGKPATFSAPKPPPPSPPPSSMDAGSEPVVAADKEPPSKKKESLIRVDLEKLDSLVNLIGELVIDRTRLTTIDSHLRQTQAHDPISAELSETLQHFSRHMNGVQDIIMKVRMVPIGNAFNRYPRIVRDLAKSLNKKIDLIIEGDHNELDKTMVEQIGDPLVHLIRNACDHGIELPEEREQAGKPPTGQVKLTAAQEGNQILITIQDDGKGMDRDVILAKGIEKGLVSTGEELSDSEIFNLIFEAGFSTATQVTNVSGRGVGMDVVRQQITQLKGSLTIDSTKGHGSIIEIRLPLTLAIVQSLLVECNDQTFAVPMDNVSEVARLSSNDIETVADTKMVRFREELLPLLYLDAALTRATINQRLDFKPPNAERDYFYVVVATVGDKRFGLAVDRLMSRQEMVIKSLGPLLQDCGNIAGGAFLGDGSVVLVVDVVQIAAQFRGKLRPQQAA